MSQLQATLTASSSRLSRVIRRWGSWRVSATGLKTWTAWRAMVARRSRRTSSSLLPENMPPLMASMRPSRERSPMLSRGFTTPEI